MIQPSDLSRKKKKERKNRYYFFFSCWKWRRLHTRLEWDSVVIRHFGDERYKLRRGKRRRGKVLCSKVVMLVAVNSE